MMIPRQLFAFLKPFQDARAIAFLFLVVTFILSVIGQEVSARAITGVAAVTMGGGKVRTATPQRSVGRSPRLRTTGGVLPNVVAASGGVAGLRANSPVAQVASQFARSVGPVAAYLPTGLKVPLNPNLATTLGQGFLGRASSPATTALNPSGGGGSSAGAGGGTGGFPVPDFGGAASGGGGEGPGSLDYEYPDDYKFGPRSNIRGAGNIGNGLCTENNKNRTQVTRGYCQMLSDLLIKDTTSCAYRELEKIIERAGSGGGGIARLTNYCSTYGQLRDTSEQKMMFVQALAGLIVFESGWNESVQEDPWMKNGKMMGGKGLFQIGLSDRGKDPDCAQLNESNILTAKANMRCGACIALKYISSDRNMGEGSGDSGSVGMARYFGPMREMQSQKRASIENSVNKWCVASTRGQTNTAGATNLASNNSNSSR